MPRVLFEHLELFSPTMLAKEKMGEPLRLY